MISPGHLLISTVPITADKFISAALSRGFDVAPRLRWGLIDAFGKSLAKLSGVTPAGFFFTFFAPRLRWDLIDAFGKSLAKLSGVTPFGYFFTPCRRQRRRQLHRSGTFAAVVLKSHGCEAVAAERADRMRVNFCAKAQKPKQQKLRGRAEVEQ